MQSRANLLGAEKQYQYLQERLRDNFEEVVQTIKKYHVRASRFNAILNISLGEDAADVVAALADWMNSTKISDAELSRLLNNGNRLPENLKDGTLLLVDILKVLIPQLASEETDVAVMLDQTILCFLFLRNYAISRISDSVGPRYVELTNEFCQSCTYLVGAKLQYNESYSRTLLTEVRGQIKDLLQLLR